MTTYTYIENPNSFGVTIEDADGGACQIAWSRPGEGDPLFSLRHADGRWSRASVMDRPERFGPRPRNRREALEFARRFAGE